MSQAIKEVSIPYTTIKTNLTEPVILQEEGKPIAAVISVKDFEDYQAFRNQPRRLSAAEARRIANRALFQELVGCALNVGDPIWAPTPIPVWRIPYRLFTGEIVAVIEVRADTGEVQLDAHTRAEILQKVRTQTTTHDGKFPHQP